MTRFSDRLKLSKARIVVRFINGVQAFNQQTRFASIIVIALTFTCNLLGFRGFQVLRSLHVVHLSDCILIEFGQVVLYGGLAADVYISWRTAIKIHNLKLYVGIGNTLNNNFFVRNYSRNCFSLRSYSFSE